MSDTASTGGGRVKAGTYLDGEWHRLHPATPLLRGGILILALFTYLAARERDQVFSLVFGLGADDDGDPVSALQRHGLTGVASLVLLGVVLIAVAGFWLSWRTSEFRIADGQVTARHGILLRTTRTARLDRVQGVTIGRPLLARLLGAARIELDVAGQNANVRLEYLSHGAAEALRRDVLHLASGLGHPDHDEADGARAVALVDDEPGVRLLAIGPARAVGAVLLSETTVVLLLVLLIGIPLLVRFTSPAAAVSVLPVLVGSVTVAARRIGRNLRYTIVGTSDGVRVGAGLLSTSNEAVPPGRIHAVRIEQPPLWRPAGWWRVAVNRAGRIQGRRNNDLERAIAPIAQRAEARALLPYLIPDLTERAELIEQGLIGAQAGEFVIAPVRTAWLRPFAWRRTGFALAGGVLLIRGGWLYRSLTLVPQARVQSVSLHQGPADRLLGVATVEVHTVHGQIHGRMELVDAQRAVRLFGELAEAGQRARDTDRADRWNAPRASVAPSVPAPTPSRADDPGVLRPGGSRGA